MASRKYRLGDLLEKQSLRNKNMEGDEPLGVSIDKEFMPSVANTIGTDLSKYMLLKRDFFACNPMHVGRDRVLPIARYKKEEPGIVSPAYFTFTADSELIDLDYLELFFKQAVFDRECWFYTDSTVRGGLSWNAFCGIEINIPSRKEQETISFISKSIARRIDALNTENGCLIELLKASAKSLYADYERHEDLELPEGWRWVEIDEIAEMVCRGITPKYNSESDETVLGQTCVRNNLVLPENGRLHMPKKITEKWLQKYDLLINSTGVGSLGRTAQVWFEPSKLVVDSHVTIVRCEDTKHALYLGFWAFEHEKYIESLHTGSTGQTELPRDHVKAIRFVLPGEEELERFNAIANPAVELIIANQQENKRLAELRNVLLPELMSGEIDVSEIDLTQSNNHLLADPNGLRADCMPLFRDE